MKLNTWMQLGCLAAISALVSCASAPKTSSIAPEEEMMQRWMEFMTPSAAHQRLNARVGSWYAQVTMFEPGGAVSMTSTGMSRAEWIMDGRYVLDRTDGEFMGQPFHGMGLIGYDNLKQRYVSTWIDTAGTSIVHAEGDWDGATKSFRYEMQAPDPVQGKYVHARSVEGPVDDNHWKMESWATSADGAEYKTLEILYTRI